MTDTATAEPKLNKRGNRRGMNRFADPDVENPGRPAGATSKYTRVIKEAILIAAEEHGRNGNGKGRLIGFMHKVIEEDLRTFCMMLTRSMLLQTENRELDKEKQKVVYKSVEEVQRELESRGISMEVMFKLMKIEEEFETIDAE